MKATNKQKTVMGSLFGGEIMLETKTKKSHARCDVRKTLKLRDSDLKCIGMFVVYGIRGYLFLMRIFNWN